ncbi:hypothetical protein [Anaeromicropila populeti]|uniref:Uncharacterized protein n=1 Tax=Anaeromicropila populeti TaxID=37658 RepID=A0A1I6JQ08_9FIRM|nr:hypothetical protein [Anaeromicropila populeti]SFR81065.1 hypothetical protein SAMN05661086_01860 [Anaeromicropila populeti]
MKKRKSSTIKSFVLLLIGVSLLCTSCIKENKREFHSIDEKDVQEMTESITTNESEEPLHTKWTTIKKEKYYCIEKMGLREYNDYYRYTVYNTNEESIYSEILGEFNDPPRVTICDDTVNIHYGYGTGVFRDKYVDYKNNLQSIWLNNVWGVGKKYVAYVIGDWRNGSDSKLAIEEKYIQNTRKEIPFPHIIYDTDVDICEFRNNETELYIHYIDKDTKEAEEKIIKLSEFE